MPPKRYCCYQNCENNNTMPGIHFYVFPKEVNRCRTWIQKCKNKKIAVTPMSKLQNRSICSSHFQDWCFMNAGSKHRLVHNAVPDCPKSEASCYTDTKAVSSNVVIDTTSLDDEPSTIGSSSVSERSEISFECVIPDFLSYSSNVHKSPTFSFSNCTWYLKMFPKLMYFTFHLYVKDCACDGKTITVTCNLKKCDGTFIKGNSSDCTFKKDQSDSVWECVMFRSEIIKESDKLLPSGKLTLVLICEMEQVREEDKQTTELEFLSSNLEELLFKRSYSDLTIKVQSKIFHAHKAILIARCPAFAARFKNNLTNQELNEITIEDCDSDSFWHFLYYLYTGKIGDGATRNVLQLFTTADKYNLKKLRTFCLSHMMQNVTEENVCDIALISENCKETGLMFLAQSFFNQNVKNIISTAHWETLMKTNSQVANKLILGMASTVKTEK